MWRVTFVFLAMLYPATNGENKHIRHRRSWIMPGTLWCGAGSTAENFTNIGVFSGVDLCCREHDHCFPQIQSFEFQFGIRNYKLHTVSHCDCDERFRQCLHAVNDTMSTLVGIMYFNILEMPCFKLREEKQCVEWHWWGSCKKNGTSPKAELQTPTVFNDTNTDDKQTPTPFPHGIRHPHASPLHKGKPKPIAPSLLSMNDVKSKRKLLKKLEREQAKTFLKGRRGTTVDSRGDSKAAKKRSNFPHQLDKQSFRKRRQWTQERQRRTKATARSSTVSGSLFLKGKLNSVTEGKARNEEIHTY